MNAACFWGSSLRDTVFGLRCSMSRRCSSAIKPDRLWYSMPHSCSIQAPTSRVVCGKLSVTQVFSRSCCASFRRHALPSWPKLTRPSIPSSSYRRYQVRIVSSSNNNTCAMALQLIPSSSSTSAFARRARRWGTDPSRASSIRSCRDSLSRKPPRIIPQVESPSQTLARPNADFQGVRVYQMEYSRNLIFAVGGRMEQVFQSLIDRSRAPLDLKTIKTILGDKGRPKYRPRDMRAAEWEVAVERPVYDLTVFKLHCGKLALKIYSKGERVLRIEAVAHNIREFRCGRSLDNFPEIVRRLKGMLERFMEALSCIDQCFIGDEMLERLPLPSRVGKSVVGGIDLNKPRLRHVAQAVIALAASTDGFTASTLADQVRAFGNQGPSAYGPRQAAYDLKKLRGKQIVQRIGATRRYEPISSGLRAITALLVLREKAIKPLLAAAQDISPTRGAQNPRVIDRHYHDLRLAMKGVFHQLGIAA